MISADVAAGQDATATNYNDLRKDLTPVGTVIPYAPKSIPAGTGWLMCYGQAVSRATYSELFAAIVESIGTFTVTIASPAVFSKTAHGLVAGDAVYFTTTGALPTGLSANTLYYVIAAGLTADAFEVAATFEGAAINTSGTQSGTHTVRHCPHGLGDGSTTFNIPDMRGNFPLGRDNLGGSSRNRVTDSDADALGRQEGSETHTLITAEIPAHTHTLALKLLSTTNGAGGQIAETGGSNAGPTGSTGGGGAHNNMPPYMALNYIIKY